MSKSTVKVTNVNHTLRRAVCMADHRRGRRCALGLPVLRVRRVWVEVQP